MQGALPPDRAPGAAALAKPLGDLAHRFWSARSFDDGPPLAGATSAAFEGDWHPGTMAPPRPTRVLCGDLEVDRLECRASLAGTELRLTPREFALLLCLVDRANRVVRRSDLLAAIWSLPDDYGSNVVDVYIRRLREKLGPRASLIRTVRGFGYCLRNAGA